MKITDEMIEAVKGELLAHGEFGSSSAASEQNAEVAAKAVLEIALSAPPAGVVKPLEAIRSAGLKARDELLERMADGGTVDNDLADYMERIVDACVNSARIMSAIEPAGVVKPLETVRHKKRGTTYEVLGVGKMQAEDWCQFTTEVNHSEGREYAIAGKAVDMREVTIYRSTDDVQIWVRPVEEFNDGRFEPASLKGDEQ